MRRRRRCLLLLWPSWAWAQSSVEPLWRDGHASGCLKGPGVTSCSSTAPDPHQTQQDREARERPRHLRDMQGLRDDGQDILDWQQGHDRQAQEWLRGVLPPPHKNVR